MRLVLKIILRWLHFERARCQKNMDGFSVFSPGSLGFGTSALYSPEVLAEKVDIIRTEEIDVYPGGTFLDVT